MPATGTLAGAAAVAAIAVAAVATGAVGALPMRPVLAVAMRLAAGQVLAGRLTLDDLDRHERQLAAVVDLADLSLIHI